MTLTDKIQPLCDELNKWCDENDMPHLSADDLLVILRTRQHWLEEWLSRWDSVVRS